MNFLIRKATLADIDELSILFNDYRIFYEQPGDMKGAVDFLKERLISGDSIIFVAEQEAEKRLTGFTQLYPLFSSVRMKPLWMLNDLFVAKEYRGLGISKLLIQEAKELAIRTLACGLTLETAKTNTTGNHLYPATGFVLEEHSNFYMWINE